jgi:hypothetical protein
LAVEVIQAGNKKGANIRIIRMGIKEMQVPDNSSDKEWNNNIEIYLNPEKAKAGIIATRVKSVRKKDSGILPSSAMRIIKKKKNLRKE